jgi:hypothetical protein
MLDFEKIMLEIASTSQKKGSFNRNEGDELNRFRLAFLGDFASLRE